jgi:hypothetical protein
MLRQEADYDAKIEAYLKQRLVPLTARYLAIQRDCTAPVVKALNSGDRIVEYVRARDIEAWLRLVGQGMAPASSELQPEETAGIRKPKQP